MLKKKKKGLFSPKTYSWIDIASIKFAVFAFTLFLVSYIPKIADINLRWFWFVIFGLAIIRPAAKLWRD